MNRARRAWLGLRSRGDSGVAAVLVDRGEPDVGGPVALTFIAVTYRMIPILSGRQIVAPKLALAQVYLYFVGMFIMSTGMHIAGLLGSPRRTAEVSYMNSPMAASWHIEMVAAAIGGFIVAASIGIFVSIATLTYMQKPDYTREQEPFFCQEYEPQASPVPASFDRLPQWGLAAFALALLAYAGPMWQHFSQSIYLAPGMRTW